MVMMTGPEKARAPQQPRSVGGARSAPRVRELEPRHTPQRTRYQQNDADGITNRTQGSGKLLNGGRATQEGAQEEKSTRKKKKRVGPTAAARGTPRPAGEAGR